MFGDFIKAPMDLLCNDLATPSTRIATIMFFDWNFDIDKDGNYKIKREKVQIDAVATYYGINKNTFRSRIQKAKKEAIIEEKTSYEEDNVVSSTIEQLLDYEAKHLSDRQIYAGCYVANVKDYLTDMIEMKGEDYAMNYMNEHWPKIDLSKVL